MVLSPLWALVIMFGVMYGSLLPLAIDWRALASGLVSLHALADLRWAPASLEDLLTNIAVYLPVGAALMLAGRRRLAYSGTRLLGIVLLGGLWSLLAELVQTAIALRVASWTDVCLNTLGTLLGACVAPVAWRMLQLALFQLRRGLRCRPFRLLAVLLTAGLLLACLAPFDVITTTSELHAAFHRAQWHVVPLTGLADAGELVMLGWFGLWGYVACLALREAGWRPERALVAAGCQGFAWVGVIEVAHLFLRSHVFELSDVFWRAVVIAMASAVAAGMTIERRRSVREPGRAGSLPRRVLPSSLLMGLVLLQVLAVAVTPARAATVAPVPFESAWRMPMALAAVQLASVALRYAVLALLIGRVLQQARWPFVRTLTWSAVLLAAVFEAARAGGAAGLSLDWTHPLLATLAVVLVGQGWRWLQAVPAPVPAR